MSVETEGWLRKRSAIIGVWRRRYFYLRDDRLEFYATKGAPEARGTITLRTDMTVSAVEEKTMSISSLIVPVPGRAMHHHGYVFEVSGCGDGGESRMVVALGGETKEDAEKWKKAIEGAILRAKERRKSRASRSANLPRKASVGVKAPPQGIVSKLSIAAKMVWKTVDVVNGMRIMGEDNDQQVWPSLMVGAVMPASPDTVFKMLITDEHRASWDGTFASIEILHEIDTHSRIEHVKLNPVHCGGIFGRLAPRDMIVSRYWRREDDGSYIICYQSLPPADCQKYSSPKNASLEAGFVRAEAYGIGFTITPPRKYTDSVARAKMDLDGPADSCYLQFACHINPGGWLGSLHERFRLHYTTQAIHLFLRPLLMPVLLPSGTICPAAFLHLNQRNLFPSPLTSRRVIGVREALELQQYGQINLQNLGAKARSGSDKHVLRSSGSHISMGKASSNSSGDSTGSEAVGSFATKGSLPPRHWAQTPEEETFNVRGKNYLEDRKKVPSGAHMFTVEAVDFFETEGVIDHIASRADSLAHELNARENAPFLLVIHFQLPGPPFYSLVGYFAARPGSLTDGSEFAELCGDFLEGNNDFCRGRFKLIPRVVEGGWVVKKSVGTTPAILGKKLDQRYYRGKNYFELDVDVGSSSVAGGILGLVKGYAKQLVIDLAFLLEGQDERELPERLIGAIRISHVDMDKCPKLPPEPQTSDPSGGHLKAE